MATFEECVDELIALASNAGDLGCTAIVAATKAYASRDRRIKRQSRDAAKAARNAEQALALARRRFLELWDASPRDAFSIAIFRAERAGR